MYPHWKTALATALCVVTCSQLGLAQVAATILELDLENRVNYVDDVFDVTKYATNPNVTTPLTAINFRPAVQINDIVAINGRPVKGTLVSTFRTINLRPTPAPGQAIADIMQDIVVAAHYQILNLDGTVIGSIMASGLGNGLIPPGSPSTALLGDSTIVGGTGAFLGARGQSSVGRNLIATRNASITEDPANRRRNGGGAARIIFTLIPVSRPAVVIASGGPAITHSSDFSLVTASKPAAAGETLSLFATGLGPTRPGVDPGKPFPSSPLAAVNSPVEVSVNGNPAQVLAAVGFPGTVDTYQVNFQVPSGTTKGPATVQVTAAWIAGPAVSIQVQ